MKVCGAGELRIGRLVSFEHTKVFVLWFNTGGADDTQFRSFTIVSTVSKHYRYL
jgi:hypothetical protein